MRAVNEQYHIFNFSNGNNSIEPGVYAMVGAAAMLAGVCRSTISIVAIMVELTGGMTYIVPFMLAVLAAKQVGDSLNDGIHDCYIVLKGYPFLEEELEVTFTERCCDIMETGLTKIDMADRPRFSDLRWLLESYAFHGFPVVCGKHFLGYITRERLIELLDGLKEHRTQDETVTLEELKTQMDINVMRMMPETPLTQVHMVFKQLGCKHIFLVGSDGGAAQDVLHGILSRKNFLRFLKSGQVGHMAQHPCNDWGTGEDVVAQDPLIPESVRRQRRISISS